MKISQLVCAALLLLAAIGLHAAEAPSREQIYAALSGTWSGQLEYRDYTSDEREILPTWLEVKPANDAQSLTFEYIYDDGPAKTVKETSRVQIDLVKMQYSVSSDRDHSVSEYKIESAEGPSRSGRMRLTLSGTGSENDRKVDERITITIDRNMYQFRKETRQPGKEFNFRDGYVLTRRDPPGK